jgi:hypothetical protein
LDALPRGLLARAAFHRSVGDWDGAARDLDEVEEITELAQLKRLEHATDDFRGAAAQKRGSNQRRVFARRL